MSVFSYRDTSKKDGITKPEVESRKQSTARSRRSISHSFANATRKLRNRRWKLLFQLAWKMLQRLTYRVKYLQPTVEASCKRVVCERGTLVVARETLGAWNDRDTLEAKHAKIQYSVRTCMFLKSQIGAWSFVLCNTRTLQEPQASIPLVWWAEIRGEYKFCGISDFCNCSTPAKSTDICLMESEFPPFLSTVGGKTAYFTHLNRLGTCSSHRGKLFVINSRWKKTMIRKHCYGKRRLECGVAFCCWLRKFLARNCWMISWMSLSYLRRARFIILLRHSRNSRLS